MCSELCGLTALVLLDNYYGLDRNLRLFEARFLFRIHINGPIIIFILTVKCWFALFCEFLLNTDGSL